MRLNNRFHGCSTPTSSTRIRRNGKQTGVSGTALADRFIEWMK
ncbi:hypothetical protein FRUB_06663 [Fimbriiglobus ruber]|uniref:Uncharacterized protein n=1 Tax=Fimbriiglobus ruber TaxID=1908690 RepID=A0A225D993_9BACT|nr:hypothetical protein FRUB_06663 [Fimbriiglobus ruber]